MAENASVDKVEEQLKMISDISSRSTHVYSPSHTGAYPHEKNMHAHTWIAYRVMESDKGKY